MLILLGLVLLCVAWLIPTHFFPWASFQQELAAGVGAALLGAAAVGQGPRHTRWPRLALSTLAIAAIPLVQLALGQIRFHADAALASLYVAGFALAMVVGATLVQTRRSDLIGGLMATFLIAGIVSTGVGLVQWLQLGPIGYITDLPPAGRPFANLGQPNHFATLQALAIIGLLWCFETRRIGVATAVLGLAWLGVGLVMTQSRSAWMFVALFALGTAWAATRVGLRTRIGAVAAAVALFVACVVGWGPLSDALLVSAQSFGQRVQPGPRFLLWHALLDALTASPWVGYGWTQVNIATQVAAADHVMQRGTLNQSHNLMLDLMLWNGIPIAIAIVALLVWWFVRRLRRVADAEGWLMLAAVGAVFLHEMVEFPLQYAYFLMPVGLLMGALDGAEPDSALRARPRMTLAAPLLVSVAVMGWVSVEYIRVELATREVRFIVAGIGVDKVSTSAPPDVWLLDAWRDGHRYWLLAPKVGMSSEELDWMQRVQQRHASPPFQARYAIAAGLNGREEEARRALIRLCHMHQVDRCRGWHGIWVQLQESHAELRKIAFPAEALHVLALQPK